MKEEIGKIKSVRYGMGGYQDACFGFSFELGGKAWGVSDFWGTWARKPDKHTKWTVADQDREFLSSSRKVLSLLQRSGRPSIDRLVGVPVRCVFDGNTLKSWDIIEDAC